MNVANTRAIRVRVSKRTAHEEEVVVQWLENAAEDRRAARVAERRRVGGQRVARGARMGGGERRLVGNRPETLAGTRVPNATRAYDTRTGHVPYSNTYVYDRDVT